MRTHWQSCNMLGSVPDYDRGLKYVRTTIWAFIASHVIVGMDSTNPRPRMPGSIPWYWPQLASNCVLTGPIHAAMRSTVGRHRGTAYRHPTYPHEQPKWCCRRTGFPSLIFILSLLHGLVVLAPTIIKKEVETSRFQV